MPLSRRARGRGALDPGSAFLAELDALGRALLIKGYEGETLTAQVNAMGLELDAANETIRQRGEAITTLREQLARHPCRDLPDCAKQERGNKGTCSHCGGRYGSGFLPGPADARISALEAQLVRERDEHRAEIKDLERDARAELREATSGRLG